MKNRVFLLQESKRDFDLSPATRIGELIPILGPHDSPSIALAPSMIKIRQALKEYDPNHDYILAAGGDQLSSFLAGCILTDLGYLNGENHVNWLRWDRNRDFDGRRDFRKGEYKPTAFNLNGPYREEWNE